jgi:hypothetical protein
MRNRYRLLLAGGKTRSYETEEARDNNAQRLADETGALVGLEVYENGDWWVVRTVSPRQAEVSVTS